MKAIAITRLVLYSVVLFFALVTAIMGGVVVANTQTEREVAQIQLVTRSFDF